MAERTFRHKEAFSNGPNPMNEHTAEVAAKPQERPTPAGRRRPGSRIFGLATLLVLAAVLVVRVRFEIVHIDQPILEGYVGRQVPTAMVARDLTRDGWFFSPKLQTAPFPSWFLIEAPIYAQAVAWLEQATDFPLERCGRIVSLLSLILGAFALGDLARRRYGRRVAFWSALFFLAWPVTIRYARAFQPDMLALGLFLLGADFRRYADDSIARDREDDIFPTLAWFSLALALMTKITLAPLLIGLAYPGIAGKPGHTGRRFLASTLVPALSWYAWAAWLTFFERGQSVGHSADGFAFWLSAPGPISLLSIGNLKAIALNLLAKAWTPAGTALLLLVPMLWRSDPAVRRWTIALACWFLVVGGKAHHAYYWLVPSPFLAVLGGTFMARLDSGHGESTMFYRAAARHLGIAVCSLMVALSFFLVLDTYDTPAQWQPLSGGMARIRAWINSTPGRPFVGQEASIFTVDRPGFRWEWSAPAQKRAAAAFGERLEGESPRALLEFYAKQGARWFLAIETDPEWPSGKAAMSDLLEESRIVHRSGGLLLYELKDIEAPAKSP